MLWLNGVILTTALVLPPNAPYQLNEEVKALLSSRQNMEALRTARQAAASAIEVLGPRAPGTAMILRNLAVTCERVGYWKLAESNAQLALSILEENFGPADVSLLPVLNVLVETYFAEGRFTEARKVATRAVAIGPEGGRHYQIAVRNLTALTGR